MMAPVGLDASGFLDVDGVRIAFRSTPGDAERASLMWLGGFHSDMKGEKASILHTEAVKAGRAFVRFDYLGHGESAGDFADGTIGRWRGDALAVIDRLTTGPLVLAGSSMGGWLALLAALARPERVRGLMLIAPAPDFTERLMWVDFDDAQRTAIMEQGFWMRPSPHDPAGYPITRALIENGRDWLLMDARIPVHAPVRILHGARDEDVPWSHSFELVDLLDADDVRWELVKDGDHRLSRPQDIARMIAATLALADQVDAELSSVRHAASPSR